MRQYFTLVSFVTSTVFIVLLLSELTSIALIPISYGVSMIALKLTHPDKRFTLVNRVAAPVSFFSLIVYIISVKYSFYENQTLKYINAIFSTVIETSTAFANLLLIIVAFVVSYYLVVVLTKKVWLRNTLLILVSLLLHFTWLFILVTGYGVEFLDSLFSTIFRFFLFSSLPAIWFWCISSTVTTYARSCCNKNKNSGNYIADSNITYISLKKSNNNP